MKKLLSFVLSLMTVFGTMETIANADITSIETTQQYELWTQSPSITSGITAEEMRLYKAMNKNEIDFLSCRSWGTGTILQYVRVKCQTPDIAENPS